MMYDVWQSKKKKRLGFLCVEGEEKSESESLVTGVTVTLGLLVGDE